VQYKGMAEYMKTPANGGYEVSMREKPGSQPTVMRWFRTDAEANAWISEQINTTKAADHSRNCRG
jgi:hypothetical protein